MDNDTKEYVNGLIDRLRDGDQEAERELFSRYYSKIQIYVKRNVWNSTLKSPEDVINEAWLKLRNWFMKHHIKAGESTVVYNLVRGFCRDQGEKDKREPNLSQYEGYEFLLNKSVSINFYENRVSILAITYVLAECIDRLSELQTSIIDLYFYQKATLKKIARKLKKKIDLVRDEYKDAMASLEGCFNEKGFFSFEDFSWNVENLKNI